MPVALVPSNQLNPQENNAHAVASLHQVHNVAHNSAHVPAGDSRKEDCQEQRDERSHQDDMKDDAASSTEL
eukprot:7133143-Ditylum_brightwellii.AAC.1